MKYFDYAATTPPSKECLEKYVNVSLTNFTNSGSCEDARNTEDECRKSIKKLLNYDDSYSVVFTSCGTESNNLSIMGFLDKYKNKNKHIITSKFEHASVYECFKNLEDSFEVSYVDIDKNGYIDINDFKNKLQHNTVFVSLMHVNNEIGTKQPIEELYSETKKYNNDIVFMSDCIQSVGKVTPLKTNVDIATISSHKIYGPKGVGAIILRNDIELHNMLFGGTKEYGMRPGTQSLPAMVGFEFALNEIITDLNNVLKKTTETRTYLEEKLYNLKGAKINVKSDSTVVSVYLNITGEDNFKVLDLLKKKDIIASAKSADNKNKDVSSRCLIALGLSEDECKHTIRISISHHTTKEEIDDLISELKSIINYNSNYIK